MDTLPAIFISYSSQDALFCRPFVAELRTAGYNCFFDEDSIPGTSQWITSIEQGIHSCDLFVLVLTPAAWASQWVQDECQLALAKRKPFLALQHLLTSKADGFLIIKQWVNIIGLDSTSAAQYVLKELKRIGQTPQITTSNHIADVSGQWISDPLVTITYPIQMRPEGWILAINQKGDKLIGIAIYQLVRSSGARINHANYNLSGTILDSQIELSLHYNDHEPIVLELILQSNRMIGRIRTSSKLEPRSIIFTKI